MSRAGYSDDLDPLDLGRWRGIIRSATYGKRGQEFFKALIEALDAMPEKRLVAGDLQDESGCVCALGALGTHRGVPLESVDTYDYDQLGTVFNIAHQLAQEVMYMNDEGGWSYKETPEDRWKRVRGWAEQQILREVA